MNVVRVLVIETSRYERNIIRRTVIIQSARYSRIFFKEKRHLKRLIYVNRKGILEVVIKDRVRATPRKQTIV